MAFVLFFQPCFCFGASGYAGEGFPSSHRFHLYGQYQCMALVPFLLLTRFTAQTWLYIDRFPLPDEPMIIFGARSSSPSRWIVKLSLLSEGDLECATPSMQEILISNPDSVRKGRWTHIALVHYPSRSASPSICRYAQIFSLKSTPKTFLRFIRRRS